MKKVSILLFVMLAIVIITHAQDRKKYTNDKTFNVQNSGNQRMLNPQPLPPKEANNTLKVNKSENQRMLNPQPLPPKADKTIKVQHSENRRM